LDVEGCLWSARWGGSCVLRHASDGTVIQRIQLPAANITSICFGGPDLDQLFITSAQEPGKQDEGGRLFQTAAKVRGRPEFKSRIAIGQ